MPVFDFVYIIVLITWSWNRKERGKQIIYLYGFLKSIKVQNRNFELNAHFQPITTPNILILNFKGDNVCSPLSYCPKTSCIRNK